MLKPRRYGYYIGQMGSTIIGMASIRMNTIANVVTLYILHPTDASYEYIRVLTVARNANQYYLILTMPGRPIILGNDKTSKLPTSEDVDD